MLRILVRALLQAGSKWPVLHPPLEYFPGPPANTKYGKSSAADDKYTGLSTWHTCKQSHRPKYSGVHVLSQHTHTQAMQRPLFCSATRAGGSHAERLVRSARQRDTADRKRCQLIRTIPSGNHREYRGSVCDRAADGPTPCVDACTRKTPSSAVEPAVESQPNRRQIQRVSVFRISHRCPLDAPASIIPWRDTSSCVAAIPTQEL
jgi:hypothetical protein